MATYLLTWNPKRWNWAYLDDAYDEFSRQGFSDDRWSTGVTTKIRPGDRVFLMRLGPEAPQGIMASGISLDRPYRDKHFSDPKRTALYIDARFDTFLHPLKQSVLSKNQLQSTLPEFDWTPMASGTTIPSEVAVRLEQLWASHLTGLGFSPISLPDEVTTPEQYWEGAVRQVTVNAYERDPKARQACIEHHGPICKVCGFDFFKVYGELGEGFIHVHHLKPLGTIKKNYEVDPKLELMPVCPNCHAMLHRKVPAYSPEELKRILSLSAASLH